MKIFDLTRGKYPEMYSSAKDSFYADKVNYMAYFISKFASKYAQKTKNDVGVLLNNVPVFLVETSMSCKCVAVPGCQCSVIVPKDNGHSVDDIWDVLGLYIYTNDQDIIPRRIFIWMDKIKYCAEEDTKDMADINDNARALFDKVLFHEMSHALMDVELYGVLPAPDFSYVKDKTYRFIEEAYANGVALSVLMDNINVKQQQFIANFVENQGPGYSEGGKLYKYCVPNIEQWLGIKTLFNNDIDCLLKDFMNDNDKDFDKLKCF